MELYDGDVGSHYRQLLGLAALQKSAMVANSAMGFIADTLQGTKVNDALSLGCGSGEYEIQLLRFAERVHGVDSSHAQIEAAQKHAGPGLRFSVMDMRAIEAIVEHASYALVTAFVSLHYLTYTELKKLFLDLYRCMEPGAWLVATINNPFKPTGGSPEMGAISRRELAESLDSTHDVPLVIDLYEPNIIDPITSLRGVYHHDAVMWTEALKGGGFVNIEFRDAYDSLVVLVAQKATETLDIASK